jgi:glycosyltransferase involved in cell wall biosynthesis
MERVHVIHEGFEKPVQPCSRAEARARLGLPAEPRIVLLFGVASYVKGSDLLMQAIDTLSPGFDICLVGKVGGEFQSGWGVDRYRGTAWESHLHVVSRFVTEEEKGLYYSACDAVVLPYRYGFMMTSGQIHNAVSYGRALIACDQFEIGRYTRDYGLGLVFKTEDVDALRQALVAFAAKPDAWFEEVAVRCRALAEEESMLNMGRQYGRLFESAARAGRRA